MSQLQDYDFRSEEVKEILGTPPNWMVRYGTLVVLVGLFLMGAFSYYIKFPDKIRGEVVLNTKGDIVPVQISEDGYLGDMFVTDSLLVEKDQALAIRKSDFLYTKFLDLREEVENLLTKDKKEALDFYPKKNLALGPFENQYTNIVSSFDKYFESITSNDGLTVKGELRSERAKLQRDLKRLENRVITANKMHRQNSTRLYDLRKRIGGTGVGDKVKEAWRDSIDSAFRLQELDANIQRTKDDISSINRKIRSTNKGKKEGNIVYWDSFQENLHNLQFDLARWEEKHFIKAPIAGRIIQYSSSWKNKFFRQGEPILGIIPKGSSPVDSLGFLTAVASVGIEGYGKVEINQDVLIKFDSYPYRQFGVVRGKVVRKSPFTRNQAYVVEGKVPKVLRTTFNKTLESTPQMTGTAEILTKERRFLERIFVQFRSVFKNR